MVATNGVHINGTSKRPNDDGSQDEDDELGFISLNGHDGTISEPRQGSSSSSFSGLEDDDDGEDRHSLSSEEEWTIGADGRPRRIYPEIEPGYSSDSSTEAVGNTIGNISLDYYKNFPHIGYDVNGKRLMRPAKGSALDQFLESIDMPKGWTGVVDKETGLPRNLSKDELEMLYKIQTGAAPDDHGFDVYAVEPAWFTRKTQEMPIVDKEPSKNSFIPSLHEAAKVAKLVKAMREGKIVPRRPPPDSSDQFFDLWADAPEQQAAAMDSHIPAPKMSAPRNAESYNPPEEYLYTEEEQIAWEEQVDPDQRPLNYLPQKFESLRRVPGYANLIQERFERCLDLYLAPRAKKTKPQIDPESLIPKLPLPKDLKPFPTRNAIRYLGHQGKVRCVAVEPKGYWCATGGDDGTVRVWEIFTGRLVWTWRALAKAPVNAVQWSLSADNGLLTAASENQIYLLLPPIWNEDKEEVTRLSATLTEPKKVKGDHRAAKPASWSAPRRVESEELLMTITTHSTVQQLSFHAHGAYLASVSPKGRVTFQILIC